MLWAQRLPHGCDERAVVAFLRGYLDGGGAVDGDDPSALGAAPAALVHWVLQNIEMAIEKPSDDQDEHAAGLIDAFLWTPRVAATRQTVLAQCLRRL